MLLSKIVLMKPSTSGMNVLGYNDLLEAMAAAVSGDLISVQCPGVYDLGAESLTLKDGVNIECVPDVTITSSASATLRDNNVACVMSLRGFPTIINTNSANPLSRRIILQNSGSAIKDFYWEYEAIVTQVGTNTPTAEVRKNTLSSLITWTYNNIGSYFLNCPISLWDNLKIVKTSIQVHLISTGGPPNDMTTQVIYILGTCQNEGSSIEISCWGVNYDPENAIFGMTAIDTNKFFVNVKVYH